MIKKLLTLLCLCSSAWATTTITGNLKTLGTGSISLGTFVRFYLRGCSGNQPRVNGTGLIGPSLGNVYYVDLVPNSSGTISGIVYSTTDATGTGNGDIECGGLKSGLWYGMQPFLNGKGGPETPIAAKNTATIDISNVTPITTNPVVVAPTGDTTYMRLDGGNSPATGAWTFNAAITANNINKLVYLDGAINTNLANCYAAIPTGGGACVVPANYTETLSANLTMNKAHAGFIFQGQATITMGTNQIIVPAGTHGVFLIGQLPYGGGDITGGAIFQYAGSSNAIQVGASSSTTRMLDIENITVNLVSGATGTATGIYLTNVVYFTLRAFSSINQSSSTTTRGIVCDGTGNFCGNGTIERAYLSVHGQGILFTGTGANAANNVLILNGISSCLGNSGTPIGLDVEASEGSVLQGLDIESCNIGVKIASGANNIIGAVWAESNTTDFNNAGVTNKICQMTQPAGTAVVVTDTGSQSTFTRCEDAGAQTYYSSSVNGEPVLIDTRAGTSQRYLEFATTNNPGFFFGINDHAATFFGGALADESNISAAGGSGSIYIRATQVRFHSAIFPDAAVDLGASATPWTNLWLSATQSTNNFKFQPVTPAAARVVTVADPGAATNLGMNYNATNGVYQSKRGVAGCTTGAAAGNSCGTDITVTWGTAFADANYSVTCTGNAPTNSPSGPFVTSGTKLAATVHINYFTITAAAASYATIDCIAVHD